MLTDVQRSALFENTLRALREGQPLPAPAWRDLGRAWLHPAGAFAIYCAFVFIVVSLFLRPDVGVIFELIFERALN